MKDFHRPEDIYKKRYRRITHPGEIVECLFLQDEEGHEVLTADALAEELGDMTIPEIVAQKALPTPELIRVFMERSGTSQKFWDELVRKQQERSQNETP